MSDVDTAEAQGQPPPRWLLKAFTRINVWVYRLSGGRRRSMHARELEGEEKARIMPVIIVTNRGRKTGAIRKTPLMTVKDGDNYVLVASKGGAPTHPVWYYNLKAYPDIVIEEGGRRRPMHARELEGEEKAHIWPICVQHYAPYADSQKRTSRQIPVFLCEPRGDG